MNFRTRCAALTGTAVTLVLLATGCGHPSSSHTAHPTQNPAAASPASSPSGPASSPSSPSTHPSAPGAEQTRPVGTKPNIILISTDDMATTDLQWMPQTRHLIGDAGVTFSDMISPHPLCCPARAEILTGQYAQNNGVRTNAEDLFGGFSHLHDRRDVIGTWMQNAGYKTAFVGKYLNGYEASDGKQPGWDIWNPIVKGVYAYYNYTMYNNGHLRHYTDLYNADLMSRKTIDYIDQFHAEHKPFFIWTSQVAPHAVCLPSQELLCADPPLPAKRYADAFPDAISPSLSDPAFNEDDVSDKPPYIQALKKRLPGAVNDEFRARIRSLQAVDDQVAATVRELRRLGELDNTVIAFISDNGYLLGQHRYMFKNVPYEQALSVPLLVRGPGIKPGTVNHQTVTMVDLAPTFADLAGTKPTIKEDGVSLASLLHGKNKPLHETVLIQSGPRNFSEKPFGWAYRGVRTHRYTYVNFPSIGFAEMYDRLNDPAELTNVAHDPRYAEVEAALEHRAQVLGSCAGADCNRRFGPLPKPRVGTHR